MDAITKKKFEEEINDEMFSIFNNMSSIFNSHQNNNVNSRKRKNSVDEEDSEMEIDDFNRITPMNDSMPKVIRRRLWDQDDHDEGGGDDISDHFYESQYVRLRNGDMDDFIKNSQSDVLPWRKALFTSYVQRFNKFQCMRYI